MPSRALLLPDHSGARSVYSDARRRSHRPGSRRHQALVFDPLHEHFHEYDLTDVAPRPTMLAMARLSRAFTSVLVVFGVLTSTWAICAGGAAAPAAQQMACCKAGHHRCPMKDSASDCCRKSGPQIESRGTIVKTPSVSPPISVAATWVILPTAVSAPHIQRRVSYDSSPPGLPFAPPAYIAFSSLLI
jgi:hypothetical protein